jgi:hypothetical protein
VPDPVRSFSQVSANEASWADGVTMLFRHRFRMLTTEASKTSTATR